MGISAEFGFEVGSEAFWLMAGAGRTPKKLALELSRLSTKTTLFGESAIVVTGVRWIAKK